MKTEFAGVEPSHCWDCGKPLMDFFFTTDRSAEGPTVGDEQRAAKNLAVAAQRYLAAIRQEDDVTPYQPVLRFQGYEEEPDGECEGHTHWRVQFEVNYKRDRGRLTAKQADGAKEVLESAAHAFALAATPATQLGGHHV